RPTSLSISSNSTPAPNSCDGSPRRRERPELCPGCETGERKLVYAAAEFASRADNAIRIGQLLELVGRISAKHGANAFRPAAALQFQHFVLVAPNLVLVKEPPQDRLRRNLAVEQFDVLERFQEEPDAPPVVRGLDFAGSLAGQGLHHQSSGTPAMS